MINTILGTKTDQTQKFLENGKRIPVTEISVADNTVIQVKTIDKDAYAAVQLGLGVKKRPIRALAGHVKKLGLTDTPHVVREVRLSSEDAEGETFKSGDTVNVESVLQPGDIVSVTGTSKGKGFAGVVKRHGFSGGPKTHGQSDRHRAPGSIGQGTTPGRVYKGKRMAGRMGSDTVTVTNLTVVDVDAENNKLYVSGLVPGVKKGLLIVTRTGEDKKFVQLLEVKIREDAKAAEEAAKAEKEAAKAAEAEAKTNEESGVAVEPAAEEAAQKEAVNEEVAETVETSSDAPEDTSDEEVKEPETPKEEEKVETAEGESEGK